MSLQTDTIFIRALNESSDITAIVDYRIYSTAIPLPDEDADNVDVPYLIVAYDGMNNIDQTKDSEYESDTDQVTIGVTVVAATRQALAELSQLVRQATRQYFADMEDSDEDYHLVPIDYTLSASAVQYDGDKPCYWQTLNYQCETNTDNYEQS